MDYIYGYRYLYFALGAVCVFSVTGPQFHDVSAGLRAGNNQRIAGVRLAAMAIRDESVTDVINVFARRLAASARKYGLFAGIWSRH